METEIPAALEPPLAKVWGIQFGLLTSDDICKLSVYEPENPVTMARELADPKLGLPIATGRCGTCNGENVDQCQGHFGHLLLPTPIYHPHHVGKLLKVLRKHCLNCGLPREKRVEKSRSSMAQSSKSPVPTEEIPAATGQPPTPVDDDDADNSDEEDELPSGKAYGKKRNYAEAFIDVEACAEAEVPVPSESVIVLSSDEDDLPSRAREAPNSQVKVDEEDNLSKTPNSSARRSWNFRKRKNPSDLDDNAGTGPVIDLTSADRWNLPSFAKGGKKQRTEKGGCPQPGVVVVEDVSLTSPAKRAEPGRRRCKYCSGAHVDLYPEVLLKVEVKERGNDGSLSKAIKMECGKKPMDMDSVAPDYWSFVEGKSKSPNRVKKSRLLLPSEALKIVRKIPEADLARIGMHPKVARPEAFIVECVAVPPNCTRIQDETFGNTNIGFKLGIDPATPHFNKLINKISSIKKSRFGKPTFSAASIEASELQSIFGLYLREKGAAKAVPGKEKSRIDHVGRVQKGYTRWSLDWVKRHMLGKRSGYSARNVLTGDPFLRVEEIGIPLQVAKYVTIPERVNKLNMDKLQECVGAGQRLSGRYRACGAVRLSRGCERLEVTRKTEHQLLVGDIVHRHLKDGDLVYVNRPPSLHKHSLLALRVHVQDSTVFTINPAICAPLHADFDGDCLHVFVPQAEEAKAELHQLMTIPAQILPSQDAKTIVSMSQDNILATRLITSAPVFLRKEDMFQMAMWSAQKLPVPVIVKAPVGGPWWAGEQVFELTIPQDFSFTSENGAVDIQTGKLSFRGNRNWLTSRDGLLRALAQHSPMAAVRHLDCCQSALREWLMSRGFSVSLRDFYACEDQRSRRNMIETLMTSLRDIQDMAVNKELIFDGKYQRLEALQTDSEFAEHPKRQEVLQDIAVGFFQQRFTDVGEELVSSIRDDNQLLAMVRSGSKGSLSKVLQQIGCLGLQLYKGEHLLSLTGNTKLQSLATSLNCVEQWEARGLVKSSLLDGLHPLEFYLHAIAVRAGLLRQSREVAEPGGLFKNLMLFLRDIHVSYDGTVRNKCGSEIIQFSYDDVKAPNCDENSSDGMAGEAVGILAATAIAQPAYQVMLEANHNVGSKKIRPLALLQDTIFPRRESHLKASDRRNILRLIPCSCQLRHCEERRALYLKDQLQAVSIQMLAGAVAVQYVAEDSEEWDLCRAGGVKLRLPWLGHVQFDKNSIIQSKINMEKVVSVLQTNFKTMRYSKVLSDSFLASPVFYFRDDCNCMGSFGPCLHFSCSLKSKTSKRLASRSSPKMAQFVDALQDVVLPLILETAVKGDERIESAEINWEDAAWSPSQVSDDGEHIPANPNGELVVEVTVKGNLSRGTPWNITKEACAMIDDIDWRRSGPFSVQEVRHSLGVEAARDCVLEFTAGTVWWGHVGGNFMLVKKTSKFMSITDTGLNVIYGQRLILATQAGGSSVSKTHLKLVADLMVHSGDVTGITPFGYRDLLRNLKASAPFTAGAFRAPMKTFMEAGEKGDEEFLSGVLASSIFGKRVPIGTGADFSLRLQPKMDLNPRQVPVPTMDILERLAKLDHEIGVESPGTPPACEAELSHGISNRPREDEDAGRTGMGNRTEVEGAWGGSAPLEEMSGWGSPSSRDGDGDWHAEDVDVSRAGEGTISKTIIENGWAEKSSSLEGPNGLGGLPSKDADGDWGAEDMGVTRGVGGMANTTDAEEGECDVKKSSSLNKPNGWDSSLTKNPDSECWGEDGGLSMGGENCGWGATSPVEENNGWDCSPSKKVDAGWDTLRKDLPLCVEGLAVKNTGCNEEPSQALSAIQIDIRLEQRSPKQDQPRAFKPTGANSIPLGKVRHFGPMRVGSGPPSVTPLIAEEAAALHPKVGGSNWGDQGCTLGESSSSHQLHEGTPECGGNDLDSQWIVTSLQEGGSEASWGNKVDEEIKDAHSGWSPRPVDFPTHDSVLCTTSSHRNEPTEGWSPRPWQRVGDGLSSQPGGACSPRINETLKDTENWKEIVDLVRRVKDILKSHEPEEKVSNADHYRMLKDILLHHPSSAAKFGCGIDFIKVANYKSTRGDGKTTKCFFLVRTDGTQDDFSYHKCLQTMASKKNPPLGDLYAFAFMPQRKIWVPFDSPARFQS